MRILSALLVCLCVGCVALAEVDESKMTCKGKVIDADGKPVADAEVRSYQIVYPIVRECIILDTTKTDSNGEFTLTWNLANQSINYGMVVAKKDGMSLGWDNWNTRESDKNKPIEMTITLGKCAVIEGVVANKEGKPIADAKVHLMLQQMQDNRSKWLMGYPSLDWIIQTTSADGKFKFDDIPENATMAFVVTAPDMARAVEMGPGQDIHQPTFKPGEKDIKITMMPEAKIIGNLVSASENTPVAGVKLLARCKESNPLLGIAIAESQADGSFEFTELLAGDYEIQLLPEPNKMQDWVTNPVTVKAVESNPVKDVCIKLSKGGILEVTVTDEKTKKPVTGANVYVESTQGMTDKNGIARLRLLPGVHTRINIYGQGYFQQGLNQKIEIAEGEMEKVDFTLLPSPKLCGIVVDQNGKPVANAALSLVGGWIPQPVKTSEDGKFEIAANYHHLSQGQDPQVYIIARQEKLNMAGMVEADKDKPEGIEIKLQPAVSIECKVTDEEGKPIENARSYIMIHLANMGTTICQTKSDEKGNIKFDAIPTGEKYQLTVEGEKHGKVEQEFETDEGDTQPLKYDIELPPATLTISGVVVDADEKPVVGANVNVYGRSQSRRSVTTDKDGKFIIKNVVDDTIQIYANSQNAGKYQYGTINAKGGDNDVVLILGQQARQPLEDSREKTLSLQGNPLKSLESFGLEPAEKLAPGKKMLVCFWDMKQRPSRHMVTTLAKQAEELASKGIVVIVVQTSQYDPEMISAWIKKHNITFAAGCVTSKGKHAERLLNKWGVQHLPWLVLTDDKHIVQAEGITPESLVD